MPRSSGAGAAGPKPTGRGRAATRVGMWSPVVEAANQVAAAFSDPNAMEGIGALDTAGDAVAALAGAFTKVGQTSLESVYFDPRVAPFFEELGRYVQAAEAPIRDGAAAVRSAHAPDIERIQEADPRKRKWDIGAHHD